MMRIKLSAYFAFDLCRFAFRHSHGGIGFSSMRHPNRRRPACQFRESFPVMPLVGVRFVLVVCAAVLRALLLWDLNP
jgi:hypothetical protein